jgi:hypothetical protein
MLNKGGYITAAKTGKYVKNKNYNIFVFITIKDFAYWSMIFGHMFRKSMHLKKILRKKKKNLNSTRK